MYYHFVSISNAIISIKSPSGNLIKSCYNCEVYLKENPDVHKQITNLIENIIAILHVDATSRMPNITTEAAEHLAIKKSLASVQGILSDKMHSLSMEGF